MVFAVAFAHTLGPTPVLVPYLAFLTLTLALGITDLDALRIVDRLNLRGTVLLVATLAVAALLWLGTFHASNARWMTVLRRAMEIMTLSLPALNEVTGRFEISDNGALANLDGLSELATVGGELTIYGNAKLATIKLPRFTAANGPTRISNNATLTSIDVANLETVKRFEISDNGALMQFSGFRAQQIGGDLMVRNNKSLGSLGSMFSLDSILGQVTIDNNAALTTLGTFTLTLRNVTSTLTVSNNPQLGDLGQISHMNGIAGSVSGAVAATSASIGRWMRSANVEVTNESVGRRSSAMPRCSPSMPVRCPSSVTPAAPSSNRSTSWPPPCPDSWTLPASRRRGSGSWATDGNVAPTESPRSANWYSHQKMSEPRYRRGARKAAPTLR